MDQLESNGSMALTNGRFLLNHSLFPSQKRLLKDKNGLNGLMELTLTILHSHLRLHLNSKRQLLSKELMVSPMKLKSFLIIMDQCKKTEMAISSSSSFLQKTST